MRINIFRQDEDNKVGGGWSFLRNLEKGLRQLGHQIVTKDYDISMACGATMVLREQWAAAADKPRILRADGVPEDHRNRGTGWSRFRDYAREADAVIYQSHFAEKTVGRLLGRSGRIIVNGVDTDIFNTKGKKERCFGDPSVIFVHYRDDPNKRFQEVIERFRQYKLDHRGAGITFLGDFPKSQVMWNGKSYDFGMLDLKQGQDWQYLGIIKDRNKLAVSLRSAQHVAYPSFADPCPNTLIEAMACGCKPLWTNSYGSTDEIVELFKSGYDFSLKHMAEQYVEALGDFL